MIAEPVRYIVSEDGQKVAVVMNIEAYYRLMDSVEELESLRAFDEAQADREEAIALKEALAEIERDR